MDLLEHGHQCACGAQAVEELIRTGFRVDIHKALDPMDPGDYVTIVTRLTRAMSRATRETEAEILRKALDNLDVDWPNLTANQRNRAVAAARAAILPLPQQVIAPVTGELTVAGPRIMKGTRRGVRAAVPVRFRTQIGVDLALRDQAILDHLTKSQALFITDEYGRRIADYSRTAKSIVDDGLRDGLGRDAITANLEARLGPVAGLRKSRNYWNVIAGTFANRSRVFAALSGFDEAGIERYIFEAVLDERTTDQCRFLHGQTFSVGAGIQRFQQVEASEDPEAVKDLQPWVRSGSDANGNRVLFTQDRQTGARTLVAQVDRSGVGNRDDTGSFSRGMSTSRLQDNGISMPPLHGLCRSTVVADV